MTTADNNRINKLGFKVVCTFILLYSHRSVSCHMNSVDDVLQVISIGLIVAVFLLNTSRYLKAIELSKECLFILKDRRHKRREIKQITVHEDILTNVEYL